MVPAALAVLAFDIAVYRLAAVLLIATALLAALWFRPRPSRGRSAPAAVAVT